MKCRNVYATQGALVAAELKRRPMTYMDMLRLGVSVCPWKRVDEWLSLHPGWALVKGEKNGLTTWRVVPAQ